MCVLIKVLSLKSKVRFVHVSSILPFVVQTIGSCRGIKTTSRREAKQLSELWNWGRRRVIRNNYLQQIMDKEMASALEPLRISVKEQGKRQVDEIEQRID